MIKLTFKNVGQGDSTIIEWIDNNSSKVVVIDCNLAFGKNPVLEHIIDRGYVSIEMVILSHPHMDHCSGFIDLLNYCIQRQIRIGYFLHTANSMPSFWKMAASSNVAQTTLQTLFGLLRRAREVLGMDIQCVQANLVGQHIKLGPHFELKVLAPTSAEIDKYAINHEVLPIEEEVGNTPSANWLSTLIKLCSGDWYILLTSDTERSVLIYSSTSYSHFFEGRMILAQVPHHGAFRNHSNAFWRRLKNNKEGIPVVFSVGKNQYGHPSRQVVDFFSRERFDIYSTNQVGKLGGSEKPSDLSVLLDLHSIYLPPQQKDKYNGDKEFCIDLNGNMIKCAET